MLVISQLPIEAGMAINVSPDMLSTPINKKTGAASHQISEVPLRYTSIINNSFVGRVSHQVIGSKHNLVNIPEEGGRIITFQLGKSYSIGVKMGLKKVHRMQVLWSWGI